MEQRDISDLGRTCAALDSCEADTTRVHTGIALNPTASRIGGGVLGLVGLPKLLSDYFRQEPIGDG